MCMKVTMVFQDIYNEDSIDNVTKKYGYRFKLINNQNILSQLSKNKKWFESAENSCECNTGIGTYDLFSRNIDLLIEQLENKSLSHIVREEEFERKEMYKKSVGDWERFIKGLIEDDGIKKVGVMLHFTDCDLSLSDFKIQNKITVKSDTLNSEYLMKIKKDTVYYFVKKLQF